MITFYALPISTYCAKVRIALRLKDIPFKEIPPPGGSYSSTDYHELIPAGSIPAIVHGDLTLHDSSAILEYLEELAPEPALLPLDSSDRARIRALANFHDTRIEPAVRKFFPLIGQTKDSKQDVDLAADHLLEHVNRFEKLIERAPYLGGESLSIADCGYPTTLNMMQKIFEHFGLETRWPDRVLTLRQSYARHPVVQDEIVKNQKALAEWIAGKTAKETTLQTESLH